MTPEELKDLKAHVAKLLEVGKKLSMEIHDVLRILVAARDESRTVLESILKTCTIPQSSKIYSLPLETDRHIFDFITSESGRMLSVLNGHVVASRDLGGWTKEHSQAFNAIDESARPTPEEDFVIRRWTEQAKIGPTIWGYYSAIPVFVLCGLLDAFHNSHCAFLGREPGRQFDLRAGVEALGSEVRDLLLDVGTSGFAILVRVGAAAIRPPMDKQIDTLRGATAEVERVFRFQELLQRLSAHSSFVRTIADSSEQTVSESFATIKRDGEVVVEIISRRFLST